MPQTEPEAWIAAATSAAVRLAAEAGAEADDILEHAPGASRARLSFQIARLEESAAVAEVASDLAGLLWAECEDVPPIATILEEPATSAALEAVAEARLQAASRVTAAALLLQASDEPETRASLPDLRAWAQAVDADLGPLPPELTPAGTALSADPVADVVSPVDPAPVATGVLVEAAPVVTDPDPGPQADLVAPAGWPAGSARNPAAGAVLAGAAAAAILLFGRRLRRA